MEEGFKTLGNLQVLEILMNDCGKFRIIPNVLAVTPIIQILALLTIIKFHARIPFPGVLIFPMAYLNVLVALTVLETVSGFLMVRSEDLISTWKIHVRRKSLQKKQLRCLQSLKVRFGNNFLDRLTALVSHNFCLDQTVSFLIMVDTVE